MAVIVTTIIHIILGPVFIYKKTKMKQKDQAQASSGKYNNINSNADLANGITMWHSLFASL